MSGAAEQQRSPEAGVRGPLEVGAVLPSGFLLSPLWGEVADTQNLGICTKLLSPVGFTLRKKSARDLQAFKPGTLLGVCQHADLLGESSRPASRPSPQQAPFRLGVRMRCGRGGGGCSGEAGVGGCRRHFGKQSRPPSCPFVPLLW